MGVAQTRKPHHHPLPSTHPMALSAARAEINISGNFAVVESPECTHTGNFVGLPTGVTLMISLPLLAGGFRVAQFVRIEREPSHWPFMAVMALSASCGAIMKTERRSEAETESGDTVEKYQ